MFSNDVFEKWLDTKSEEIMEKIGSGKSLSSEEMIILVLKAQSNHFAHLDMDLRADMKDLRMDVSRDMKDLRVDMDKRFEQVDKRFEQVDKRFDRIFSFMKWQTGLLFAALAGLYVKLILG